VSSLIRLAADVVGSFLLFVMRQAIGTARIGLRDEVRASSSSWPFAWARPSWCDRH